MEGKQIGNTDIIGHEVHVCRFVGGTITENMHNLDGTMQDIGQASADFFFICGEKDTWVDAKDLNRLQQKFDALKIRWVPGAMHELRENPKSAKLAFEEAVFACKFGRFSRTPQELSEISKPEKTQVLKQNRREREKLKKANPLVSSETNFWKEYLGKYGILEHIVDFQDYVHLLIELLGEVKPEHCILDAGCGNGLVGSFFQRHLPAPSAGDDSLHPVYFGLDLTDRGLGEAMTRHANPRSRGKATSLPAIDFQYLRYDLEVIGRHFKDRQITLPFESETFDKICCSLLVSYLSHPDLFLRECHRLLKPGGRIVVSSMKPYCDLSNLYTTLMEDAREEAVVDRARDLLSAAGAIRLKEEQGHYTFFSKKELLELAKSAGFRKTEFYRSFGNQANLIVAVK
jgi:SAM-dependent methyltransferase